MEKIQFKEGYRPGVLMCVSLAGEEPNKILAVQQRLPGKGLIYRIPTEGVEGKESLYTTLTRGLLEELGILENRVKILGICHTPLVTTWGKKVIQQRERNGKPHYYGQQNYPVVATVEGSNLFPDKKEVLEAKWFTEPEVFRAIQYKPPISAAMKAFREFKLFL